MPRPFSHRVYSDLFDVEYIVQQTGIMHTKNILIDTLRDIFRQDRQYKYVQDVFGFPKVPSQLGLDPDSGYDDEDTTRIFIGSAYRYDTKFNPSITVRNTSSKYVPISFNQNYLNMRYRVEKIDDGYGNYTTIRTPHVRTIVGAWDQTFEVKVTAESEVDREEIADIVQPTLMGSRRLDLQNAGVFIKSINSSGESEEQYINDYLYTVAINVDVRTEWKIHEPINDFIDRLALYITFDSQASDENADGLTINQTISEE